MAHHDYSDTQETNGETESDMFTLEIGKSILTAALLAVALCVTFWFAGCSPTSPTVILVPGGDGDVNQNQNVNIGIGAANPTPFPTATPVPNATPASTI